MKITFRSLFTILLLICAGAIFAKPVTPKNYFTANVENRNVSGFKGIELSGSYDYFITQGSKEAVRVEAPKELLPKIITEVKDGVLHVYTKANINWNIFRNEKIAVYITVKDINSIALSGSGDLDFKEGINATELKIKLSGSGDVEGKINATSVEGSLAGSGDVKLSGRTQNLKVKLVGSGDFSARELQSTNAYVELVGSGDVDVYASGNLNAKLSGSGDIGYSGNPKSVSKTKSGSGDINRH